MPLPFLAPLLLKFPILGKLPWRLIGTALAILLAVWFIWRQVDAYGDRRAAAVHAEYAAAQAKATAEHNARIDSINKDHHAASKDLEGRLQAALAKPPVVRIVRLQGASTCPAAVTADAGQPPAADTGSGPVGAGEEDYRVFRDAVLRLGADAEIFRKMALDAKAGWPK